MSTYDPDRGVQTGLHADLERARTLLDLRRGPQARQVLAQLLSSHPEEVQVLQLLSYSHLVDGDPSGGAADAEAAARAALRADPEQDWSWRLLGHALAGSGRLGEAEQALQRAVELAPNDASGWAALSTVQAGVPRRKRQARRAAERAVTLAPHSPDAHLARAVAAHARSNLRQAQGAVATALQLDPQHPGALHEQARLRLSGSDLTGALRGFLRVAAADPHDTAGASGAEHVVRRLAGSFTLMVWVIAYAVITLLLPGYPDVTTRPGPLEARLTVIFPLLLTLVVVLTTLVGLRAPGRAVAVHWLRRDQGARWMGMVVSAALVVLLVLPLLPPSAHGPGALAVVVLLVLSVVAWVVGGVRQRVSGPA